MRVMVTLASKVAAYRWTIGCMSSYFGNPYSGILYIASGGTARAGSRGTATKLGLPIQVQASLGIGGGERSCLRN